MSQFMELDEKKKAEKQNVKPAAQQTVQRDLSDVNGPEGGKLPDDVSSRIQSLRGSGQPLSDRQLSHYSEKFGRDMSDVRVHTDVQSDTISRSLNARAFTIGSDVFLTKGINPEGGGRDQQTMTHELTHVVQQNGKAGYGALKLGAADTAQEHEAESTATAQREFEPDEEAADTVQRGFWSSVGSAIGGSLLQAAGLKGAYDNLFGGSNKVKAAVRKLDPGRAEQFRAGEEKIAELEGKGPKSLKTLENNVARYIQESEESNETEMDELDERGASKAESLPNQDEANAVSEYQTTYKKYEETLDSQLKMVQSVDPSITTSDMDRYRTGGARKTFSMFASMIGGSFLAGFSRGNKAEAAKAGSDMVADYFTNSKRKHLFKQDEA